VLGTDLSNNSKSITTKQKGGSCVIVSHSMLHVADGCELSGNRTCDIHHLVVTCNSGGVRIGLGPDEKTVLSQGLSRAEICNSRDHSQLRPLGIAYVEYSFLPIVTKIYKFRI